MMSGRESETEGEFEDVDSDSDTRKALPKPKSIESYRSSVLMTAEYAIKFPVVRKSTVSDTHSYCVICNCNFSIGHGGVVDVAKHVQS